MKNIHKLLVANRGEVAIRVMRAAALLGVRSVAVFSEDDAHSLHTRKADEARPLRGRGSAAYLDADHIVSIAAETGCDAVHPGYGFLSENAPFARRCAEAGVAFVGPRPEVLELFGDKVRARALAARCGVPVLPGTAGPATLPEATQFIESLGLGAAAMIKAVAGGGGRGMRVVRERAEIEEAYDNRSAGFVAYDDVPIVRVIVDDRSGQLAEPTPHVAEVLEHHRLDSSRRSGASGRMCPTIQSA